MSEKTETIIQTTEGYAFKIEVENVVRTPKEGSKYDDAKTTKYMLSGNTKTLTEANIELLFCKNEINKLL